MSGLLLSTTADGLMQVLSIVTVAVAFVAMAGSIFGMNLYFNVAETPPVSLQACVLSVILVRQAGEVACIPLTHQETCVCDCHLIVIQMPMMHVISVMSPSTKSSHVCSESMCLCICRLPSGHVLCPLLW